MSVVDDNNEKDENKEAAESDRNCNLGEIPKRNSHNKRGNRIHVEENVDEPEILEVVEDCWIMLFKTTEHK